MEIEERVTYSEITRSSAWAWGCWSALVAFHHLSLCQSYSISLDDKHTGQPLVNMLSSVWHPIMENSFQIQALGCLSIFIYKVINLHHFCLYMPLSVGDWEGFGPGLLDRGYFKTRNCSSNCYLFLIFIQLQNVDMNIVQEKLFLKQTEYVIEY